MEKAGVTPTNKEERKMVDLAMREIVGKMEDKCPEVWKEIKSRLQEPNGEAELVSRLQEKIKG